MKVGAKHVHVVEGSTMVDTTKEIIKANYFGDVIIVLKGNIEEINLSVEKVDIFEWMNYFLIFENMLNTIFYS